MKVKFTFEFRWKDRSDLRTRTLIYNKFRLTVYPSRPFVSTVLPTVFFIKSGNFLFIGLVNFQNHVWQRGNAAASWQLGSGLPGRDLNVCSCCSKLMNDNEWFSVISCGSRTLRSSNKIVGYRISGKVRSTALISNQRLSNNNDFRLRAANVLLIGIRGLGSEIAKNILLSGINSLTVLDDGIVTKEEQVKNFFLPRSSIGQKVNYKVLEWLFTF